MGFCRLRLTAAEEYGKIIWYIEKAEALQRMEPAQNEETMAKLPSSAALAFLGDAVYSLYARTAVVAEGYSHAGSLHEAALSYVTAQRQSEALSRVLPLLNEREADVLRRARNSTHLQKPKHMSKSDYRNATGLEAVFGLLWWLGDRERLRILMDTALGIGAHNKDLKQKGVTEDDTEN